MIPFFRNLGAIIYNNKFYLSDYDALDTAIANQDLEPERSVWFNDDIFEQCNWLEEPEPEVSLDEFYRRRAQQLRDKYPYLILSYSGGADSTQILKTFQKHNIHLDEIHTNFPLKLLERTKVVHDRSHPLGFIFEYELSAKPNLRDFNKKFPNTKIVVNDYTDYFDKNYSADFFVQNDKVLVRTAGMYNDLKRIYQKELFQKITEHKPNSAIIFSADKPHLRINNNGELVFAFTDIGRTMASIFQAGDVVNYTPELFYWTGDMPYLPIKQSHTIKRFLKDNPSFYKSFSNDPFLFLRFRDSDLHKSIIYQDWVVGTYQKLFKNVDEGIMDHFFEEKNVYAILEEKNRYYYERYKSLKNVYDIRAYRADWHNSTITWPCSRSYSLGTF